MNVRALGDAVLDRVERVVEAAPQLATGALGLGAWVLLSSAAAAMVQGPVWRISLGLLGLSLFGWKFAFVIARDGVYTMTHPKRRGDG